jgi:hypothetical protein
MPINTARGRQARLVAEQEGLHELAQQGIADHEDRCGFDQLPPSRIYHRGKLHRAGG